MKASATQNPVVVPFTPIELTLILTSQEEADAIHNLFNCCQVLDVLAAHTGYDRFEWQGGAAVRDALTAVQHRSPYTERGYKKFFAALRRQFIPDGKMLVDDHPTFNSVGTPQRAY